MKGLMAVESKKNRRTRVQKTPKGNKRQRQAADTNKPPKHVQTKAASGWGVVPCCLERVLSTPGSSPSCIGVVGVSVFAEAQAYLHLVFFLLGGKRVPPTARQTPEHSTIVSPVLP